MHRDFNQPPFEFYADVEKRPDVGIADAISSSDNSINSQDRAFHDWDRFVLSYPPHLVRDYIRDFNLSGDAVVLDPFCGTGTTVVESQLNHLQAFGLEANPFPRFASTVKTNWGVDPEHLKEVADTVANDVYDALLAQGINDQTLETESSVKLRTLSSDAERALIKNSISPLPLHKSLVLQETLRNHQDSDAYKYCILALGNALVTNIGNLRFGPEVGVGKVKTDVQVVALWKHEVERMVADLSTVSGNSCPQATVYLSDSREAAEFLQPASIDAVITSPPYPNEKDYTRTTRLESVVLGFFEDMSHLRSYKKTLLRSNTRGVYKVDDDDLWISDIPEIQKLAEQIEARRLELGKTSGFEKLYGRVTKLYFGGMARHLTELTKVLRPGAQLAYVVGDQASYLRIMIRTGQLLALVADKIGYEVERIDLFRTRFATATQSDLREEVLILRWPG